MPKPEEPPESVVLSAYTGLKNTVSKERLTAQDLEVALNVDLDDVGQPRRRRGHNKVQTGVYHSLYDRVPGKVFVVKDGWLGELYPDYSFRQLVQVNAPRLAYATIDGALYFSSDVDSGIVHSDYRIDPWGSAASAPIWVSPVVNPTDTMGAIAGKNLHAPPMATDLATFNGRIYMADRKLLWATEYLLYGLVDRTKNFVPFEHAITLLAAAGDGIYVGTEAGLYFLKGDVFVKLSLTCVSPAKVVPGSLAFVPTDKAHPRAREQAVPTGEAAMFLTDTGIFLALDGGECFNLTQGRMEFPGVEAAAGLYREDSGVSSYVAVANSGGSPVANARIGDHVDAEIVRASQR